MYNYYKYMKGKMFIMSHNRRFRYVSMNIS